MFTPDDSARNRASLVYQLFTKAYCRDWPAAYLHLLPAVEDLGELHRCRDAIEQLMADDQERVQQALTNPWGPLREDVAALKQFPDSRRKKSGVELLAENLVLPDDYGLPAPIKAGLEFENHPEVAEARKTAHRTAEYVAYLEYARAGQRESELHRAIKAAEGQPDVIEMLQKQWEAARSEVDKAGRELNRVGKTRKTALKIVRDALTPEQIKAEWAEAAGSDTE